MYSEEIQTIIDSSDGIKMVVARPRAVVNTGTDP